MKFRFFTVILTIAICLSGCGHRTEIDVSYTSCDKTETADKYFDDGKIDELKAMCKAMAANNENPEERDNFFYYILTKAASVTENAQEDKYADMLDILGTCLSLPLAQPTVADGFRQYYTIIDYELTQNTQQYMVGRWIRMDNTVLSGTVIEVTYDENEGLKSQIITLPKDDSLKFEVGDFKWTNIQFANYKKFYFSDLTAEKISQEEKYYNINNGTAVKVYSGAIGEIDFENDIIKVSYEKSNIIGGEEQLWVKEGSQREREYSQKLLEKQMNEQNTTPDSLTETNSSSVD